MYIFLWYSLYLVSIYCLPGCIGWSIGFPSVDSFWAGRSLRVRIDVEWKRHIINVCDFFPFVYFIHIHARYVISSSKPWDAFKWLHILFLCWLPEESSWMLSCSISYICNSYTYIYIFFYYFFWSYVIILIVFFFNVSNNLKLFLVNIEY